MDGVCCFQCSRSAKVKNYVQVVLKNPRLAVVGCFIYGVRLVRVVGK